MKENNKNINPDVLYHYTSVSGFFGIIKSQSIWLSDISKSNDSLELRYFLDEFEKLLHRVWDSLISERREAGYSDSPIEVQDLYSEIIQALHSEAIKCWAFCLTEKRDD